MCVPLLPIYVRDVWDYKKVNIENNKKAISKLTEKKIFKIFL